jgi:ectoine hydroxylase-related dioxygenase (phytanoyl-CoA dioxygenase family)
LNKTLGMAGNRRLRSVLNALAAAGSDPFGSDAFVTHPTTPATPPPNPEQAAAFTPTGLLSETEQRRLVEETNSFRENGFLIIEDALAADQLSRVQAAYERVIAPFVDEWEASAATGGHDVPRALEKEEALLELIENPRVVPLLSQVVGEDVQIRQVQTRYIPGNQPRDATVGYTGWHRDKPNYHNAATQQSLWLKVFYYFYDVAEDGGPTAIVPRTHTSSLHPRNLDPPPLAIEMPGHVKVACKAGTALLFDTRVWHCAMPNFTPDARRCMILNYCNFWHKQFGEVANGAARLLEAGQLESPLRKQLLGLEVMARGMSQSPPGTNQYSGEWVAREEARTGQVRAGAW